MQLDSRSAHYPKFRARRPPHALPFAMTAATASTLASCQLPIMDQLYLLLRRPLHRLTTPLYVQHPCF
jgi:hypothetical protein